MALLRPVLLFLLVAAVASDSAFVITDAHANAVLNDRFRFLLKRIGNTDELNALINRADFVLDTESILGWSIDGWYYDMVHPYGHLTRERLMERLPDNSSLGDRLVCAFSDLHNDRGMKHVLAHYDASPEVIGKAIDSLLKKDQSNRHVSRILDYLVPFPHILPNGGVYDPTQSSDYLCRTNDYEGMRAYLNKHPEQVYEMDWYYTEDNCHRRTLAVIKGVMKRLSCAA
jgi:hypothetical protein